MKLILVFKDQGDQVQEQNLSIPANALGYPEIPSGCKLTEIRILKGNSDKDFPLALVAIKGWVESTRQEENIPVVMTATASGIYFRLVACPCDNITIDFTATFPITNHPTQGFSNVVCTRYSLDVND